MKKLYRYYEDFGRMGCLDGLFIMTPEELQTLMGKSFCWYELLGKHSEGEFTFSEDNITALDVDENAVEHLFKAIGMDVAGPLSLHDFLEGLEE